MATTPAALDPEGMCIFAHFHDLNLFHKLESGFNRGKSTNIDSDVSIQPIDQFLEGKKAPTAMLQRHLVDRGSILAVRTAGVKAEKEALVPTPQQLQK